ncbi:unnamed protein product [Candida verbasci]|uniref:t-SNARE coiled-coil homology domain-containing protein n=1 Tax=Candida verbasci TaxID=1227364 RepID=A0A9W4TRC2_9ASCO|nr:unnamed protein product [Candida verbasci]
MFRDRTNLFLSYRRTITRDVIPKTQTKFSDLIDEEENEGLIISNRKNNNNLSETSNGIELKPYIPTIFDISNSLHNLLNLISSDISDLNSIYKQFIIVNNSNDKKNYERKIEDLNYKILKNFENCYVNIKKFEYLNQNHEKLKLNYTVKDVEILLNFKKKYANKIQENLLVFRNLQNSYMKFLKNDEDDEELNQLIESKMKNTETGGGIADDDVEGFSKQLLTQQTITQDDVYLQQREKEINQLAMGILEISTIFKEMETMVIDQGTLLDRVDYNLQNTVVDLKSSDKELIKAQNYQKRTQKCKIIFFLSLCVFALLMLFMLRPSSKTKIIEKPSNDKPNNDIPATEEEAINDKPLNIDPDVIHI